MTIYYTGIILNSKILLEIILTNLILYYGGRFVDAFNNNFGINNYLSDLLLTKQKDKRTLQPYDYTMIL